MTRSSITKNKSQKIAEKFLRHISKLIIFTDPNDSNSIIANGTISFIDSGSRKFALTCNHVFEEFEKNKENGCRIAISTGKGCVLDISDITIIDRDSEIDLITLDIEAIIPDIFICDKDYFLCKTWPLNKPELHDNAFSIGFPGSLRTVETKNKISISTVHVENPVSSVSSQQFTARFSKSDMLTYDFRESNSPKIEDPFNELDFGGVSGSLVYCHKAGQIFNYEEGRVAGFIYEVSNPSNEYKTLCCRHLYFLREDGTIDGGLYTY